MVSGFKLAFQICLFPFNLALPFKLAFLLSNLPLSFQNCLSNSPCSFSKFPFQIGVSPLPRWGRVCRAAFAAVRATAARGAGAAAQGEPQDVLRGASHGDVKGIAVYSHTQHLFAQLKA